MKTLDQQFRIIAIDDEKDILEYYQEVLAERENTKLDSELSDLFEITGIGEVVEPVEEGEEERIQFNLTTVDSGEVGFGLIRQSIEEEKPFSVAFIDMRMPGSWDGLKTAKNIRSIDPYVTIIFITAYMDYSLSDIRNAIGEHFSFLTKPIKSEELYQVAISSSKTWQQLRDARRLSQSKDDFLASVSHELRTPLTSIIGNAEIVLSEIGQSLDGTHRSMIESILKAGQGQLALVNDVLDLSKIQAGRFQISNNDFNLQALLSDLESLFQSRANPNDVTFTIELEQPPQQLLIGDAQRIEQILSNLLSNAFKFTQQGSVSLRVELKEDRLVFAVSDSGIGIAADSIDRLFHPFEQADSSISRRFGGTGLGLSISRSLAQLMGGGIDVESEEGRGSIFTLTLPLLLSNRSVKERELAEAAVPDQQSELYFKGRILVAEDTPELQALLKHMLTRRGLEVVLVANGEEAVEQALQQQMDLILMDMQMPVMNGIEATKMLRSVFCNVPVVALTANVMDDHKQQFEDAGANGFLSKPVDQNALLEMLSKFLETTEQSGELGGQSTPLVSKEAEEIFKKELVNNANQLRDALYIEDLGTIQQIAHKFKGVASSFGFDELGQIGKAVCDAHHQEQYHDMRQLSNQMLMMALEASSQAEETE